MNKLIGLVVCGGQSTRMGMEKYLLDYHGLPQYKYVYNLLKNIDIQAFISCNSSQKAAIPAIYHTIVDTPPYLNIGPMAALLSAHAAYPDASFVVVGCDYPFMDDQGIEQLKSARDVYVSACAFYNEDHNMFEPLLAIYEPAIFPTMVKQYQEGNYSLQKLLKSLNAVKVIPYNKMIIKSIDTTDQYEAAKNIITTKQV